MIAEFAGYESPGKRGERGRHVTSIGKLYRANEAIKPGRKHIITAYKGARKILPIPARNRGCGSRKDDQGSQGLEEDERRERERERSALFFFSCKVSVVSFFFRSPKSIDRSDPSTDDLALPEASECSASFTAKQPNASLRANNPANVTCLVQIVHARRKFRREEKEREKEEEIQD